MPRPVEPLSAMDPGTTGAMGPLRMALNGYSKWGYNPEKWSYHHYNHYNPSLYLVTAPILDVFSYLLSNSHPFGSQDLGKTPKLSKEENPVTSCDMPDIPPLHRVSCVSIGAGLVNRQYFIKLN